MKNNKKTFYSSKLIHSTVKENSFENFCRKNYSKRMMRMILKKLLKDYIDFLEFLEQIYIRKKKQIIDMR